MTTIVASSRPNTPADARLRWPDSSPAFSNTRIPSSGRSASSTEVITPGRSSAEILPSSSFRKRTNRAPSMLKLSWSEVLKFPLFTIVTSFAVSLPS
ncbi:MAG: hypothetical protein AAGI70_08810 [Pseudomonadota bacterium]